MSQRISRVFIQQTFMAHQLFTKCGDPEMKDGSQDARRSVGSRDGRMLRFREA